jgi:hypothetical protein
VLAYLQLNCVVTANGELKQTVFVLLSDSLFSLRSMWNLFKRHIGVRLSTGTLFQDLQLRETTDNIECYI